MRKWSIIALTVAWLIWELISSFDGDPHTWPLTLVIVQYVPEWITLPAVAVLITWLPWHFISNYQKQMKASKEARMANPLPVPADTATDAKNRALRTFVQGLVSDAVLAAVATLTAAIADPKFVLSKPYLTAVGLLLLKSVVTAAVSYVARYAKPPATS